MENYEYLTIKQVVAQYPFTDGQLRGFLMARRENGLDKAVRKIGKRLYIRSDLFQEWIENHKDGENGSGE